MVCRRGLAMSCEKLTITYFFIGIDFFCQSDNEHTLFLSGSRCLPARITPLPQVSP